MAFIWVPCNRVGIAPIRWLPRIRRGVGDRLRNGRPRQSCGAQVGKVLVRSEALWLWGCSRDMGRLVGDGCLRRAVRGEHRIPSWWAAVGMRGHRGCGFRRGRLRQDWGRVPLAAGELIRPERRLDGDNVDAAGPIRVERSASPEARDQPTVGYVARKEDGGCCEAKTRATSDSSMLNTPSTPKPARKATAAADSVNDPVNSVAAPGALGAVP